MPSLRRVPTFLLAGQSNAEGRGLNTDLPADHLGPYADAEIYDIGGDEVFEPLEIGVNNKSLSPTPTGVHGPEVTLFRALRDLFAEPVFFVKTAMDATTLAQVSGVFNDWGPGAFDLAVGAMDALDLAAADLATRGLAPDVRGIFFHQGESDCLNATQAAAYEANLRALIAYWRGELVDRGHTLWPGGLVPFIGGKIHTGFTAAFRATVNAAKVAVAADTENVVLVETDDLPTINPDPPHPANIHFTSAGALTLGLRLAQAWATIPPPETFPVPADVTIELPPADGPTVEQEEPRYEAAGAVLLPRGLAWTRDRDSNLQHLIAALARTWARMGVRAKELERELVPGTATELLLEWEKALGIPGGCGELPPTLLLRRAAAAAKLAFRGGQNTAFFIALAESLGFQVEVVQYDGTTCNDTCNDFVAGPEWVFAWKVRAPKLTPFFFHVGSSVIGERLSTTNDALLECYIEDAKPAQTFVLFAYDLDVPPTTYVPWEFVRPGYAVGIGAAPIVTTKKTAPV